jgi:hypothetical protein
MANVNLNALVDGLSGKVGKNLVLRQRGGRTFLGSRPSASGTISDKQRAHRERFQKAVRYARTSMLVPATKAEYEASVKDNEFMSAFTAAVTDYLKAPVIDSIDLEGYTGTIGDVIAIRSAVDYKLLSVKVSIQQADGTEIEGGVATTSGTRVDWLYVATKEIPALAGMKLVVTAKDRPGNEVTEEKILS